MNLNSEIEEFRQKLKSHGYAASTIRSYCFYVKDFLEWVAAQQAKGKALNAKNALAGYGLHLKEERSAGPSAVNQGLSAVSFFLKRVVKGDPSCMHPGNQPSVTP